MTDAPDHVTMLAEYNEKVAAIRPILSDLDSMVEGAVLAELSALWLAKQESSLHDMLIKMQIMQILRMVPFCTLDLMKERDDD